jgi:hypothetical protein
MEVAVKEFVLNYVFGCINQANRKETSGYPSAFRRWIVLRLSKHQAKVE